MNIKKYHELLGSANEIALATAVENRPNVRIVNFCYNPTTANVLYFASDRSNNKVTEFAQNSSVAFTSIPKEGISHIRSIAATVQKSGSTIDEMVELFIAAIPGYDETISAIGDTLDLFEIHVSEAMVISGFEEADLITF